MKPKEYIKQFGLDNKLGHFNRSLLCQQLQEDFAQLLAANSQVNYIHFENATKLIKQKFDNIFRDSSLSEEAKDKFWKFFFATKIIPIRNTYFGFKSWKEIKLEYKLKTDKDFRRSYETAKFFEKLYTRYSQLFEEELREQAQYFKQRLNDHIFNPLESRERDLQISKSLLGFSEEDSLEENFIKRQFRIMPLTCHPDTGGDSEAFLKLTAARDFLLDTIKLC